MLHEIFISLSGIPSPIWSQLKENGEDGHRGLREYVSAPEQAMLANLSHLSHLHIKLKEHTIFISAKHPSVVCRGISTSISNKHLAAFKKKIVDVESAILQRDAGYVGGYNIVPLSTILAHFAPWISRLEWLLKITGSMMSADSIGTQTSCSCAEICRILEQERHTGYADIGDLATDLLQVAHSIWMRCVAPWVLYGQLPSFGIVDFMIQKSTLLGITDHYELKLELVPIFVTKRCADTILAIGNSLNQLRSTGNMMSGPVIPSNIVTSLLSLNLPRIKSLSYPLNSSLLEAAMVQINQTISTNALSQMLPLQSVLDTTCVINHYLLLGRGEFAMTLIKNADERLSVRYRAHTSSQPVRKLGKLEDMSVKAAELATILAKTWSNLSALQGELESEEEVFLLAKQLLRLSVADPLQTGNLPMMLAPSPTLLKLELPADSPIRLFLTSDDMDRYAGINAYLLSIRRAELRVSDLWKLTAHRRCHPAPLAPPMSATPVGQRALAQRRAREGKRNLQMRRHWSSMSSTLFFLNELGAYLHGEVIHNSWEHFNRWLTRHKAESPHIVLSETGTNTEASSRANLNTDESFNPAGSVLAHTQRVSDDPRVMAQAHQAYLDNLYAALLLNSSSFIDSLKALLNLIDHFIALFDRLREIWQGLDLQEDDGVMDAFTNYAQDEKDISTEMDRSRNELEPLLRQLVDNIRDIEKDRDMNTITSGIASVASTSSAAGGFAPWKVRTLDRLIMKLDFLQGGLKADSDDEDEFVDAL